jgi:hypothetical protein
MTQFRSYSQFSRFGQCPRKDQLARRYEPKVKAAALAEGEIFHLALAKMYSQGKADAGRDVVEAVKADYLSQAKTNGVKPDVIDRLEQKFSNLSVMLDAYASSVLPYDLNHYEIVAVEREFSVELEPGVILKGFIDGIWKDRSSGVRFIVEHKYKSSHDDDLIPLDLQVSLYTLALLPEFGPLPTLYNVCLKPANRRGKNETAQDFAYRVAQSVRNETAGFQWTPGEFSSRYFLRRTYSRGRADLTAALQQVRSMNRIMELVEKNPEMVWRNVGEHCLYMCPFKPICIEEDPLVIQQLYEVKGDTPQGPRPI